MITKKLNRHRIIEKATGLFIKQGYNNTCMDDIAKACRIKKSSVYHHIPSRRVLVIEALSSTVSSFKANQFNLAYDGRYSVSERLVNLLKAVESKGYCLVSVLMLETAGKIPEVISLAKEYFTHWMLAIAHLLHDHYGDERAKVLAQDAVSQLQGAIILSSLFQDPEILKAATQSITALLPKEQ